MYLQAPCLMLSMCLSSGIEGGVPPCIVHACQGVIKNNLSVDDFINCAQTKRPDNTLFPEVSSVNIGFSDMEKHFDLLIGLFKTSPQGGLTSLSLVDTVVFVLCTW